MSNTSVAGTSDVARPRKSRWKLALRVLIGLPFLFWLYTRFFWPSNILDTPEILANLYAKEICSCVFIVRQSENICMENTRQFMPPGRVVIERAKNQVSTRVFWSVAHAKYHGPGDGCRIFFF